MNIFKFGDIVEIKKGYNSLIDLMPKDTNFCVSTFDDPAIDFIPILSERNGASRTDWVKREAVSLKE